MNASSGTVPFGFGIFAAGHDRGLRNASGSISGFAIARDGLPTAASTTVRTPSPRDLDFDASGRYLHAVSPGTADAGGQVTSYRVGRDGSLTVVGTAPAAAGMTGAAAL